MTLDELEKRSNEESFFIVKIKYNPKKRYGKSIRIAPGLMGEILGETVSGLVVRIDSKKEKALQEQAE